MAAPVTVKRILVHAKNSANQLSKKVEFTQVFELIYECINFHNLTSSYDIFVRIYGFKTLSLNEFVFLNSKPAGHKFLAGKLI